MLPLFFKLKNFEELSLKELYEILQLRSEIFVVEQDCVYQDIDDKDQKALHVFGKKNGVIVAYARCFGAKIYFDEAAIGRVVVKENQRESGIGHQLIKASIKGIEAHYKTINIKVSAQQYLIKFYEAHGFKIVGKGYLEDGIPHIAMVRE